MSDDAAASASDASFVLDEIESVLKDSLSHDSLSMSLGEIHRLAARNRPPLPPNRATSADALSAALVQILGAVDEAIAAPLPDPPELFPPRDAAPDRPDGSAS